MLNSSSPSIFSQIEKGLASGQTLEGYIPLLLNSLANKERPAWVSQLSQNQKIAQLENFTRGELKKV